MGNTWLYKRPVLTIALGVWLGMSLYSLDRLLTAATIRAIHYYRFRRQLDTMQGSSLFGGDAK